MRSDKFLKNTDLALNSRGYLDVLRQSAAYFSNDAGATAAINTLDVALIAERNNLHTLLVDGITDVTVVSVVNATGDNGARLRYIAKGLIDAMEANIAFPGNVDLDQSIAWGTIASLGLPLQNLPDPVSQTPTTFKAGFVNAATGTTYGYTTATRTTRAASIAAAYALYNAVAAL